MKIATWNVNSLGVRLPQVLAWLAAHQPDVLCLQETKLPDDKFTHAEFKAVGYESQWFGQKTYNGVALISKAPATEVTRNIFGFDDEQTRVIAGSVGGIRVIGAYFPNGQSPDSDKFAYKMKWLDALREWVKGELAVHPRLALMGDFNIAPDDRDVCDPAAWAGQIHCTNEEREHFQQLLKLGLHDAFRLFEQEPKLYSWWDYRMLAFRRNQGLRIDHILVSGALRPQVRACHIDKLPRKNERPSDHAPVVVELV
jgi:exodeoxyribonuclease-3